MENSDIIEIIAIIITFAGSAVLIILQLSKNRKLETVKYLSMIRKEIWDITEFKKLKDITDTGKRRSINQKLEYLAATVNHCVFNRKLVRLFCGRWFNGSVDDLGTLSSKEGKSRKKGEYDEIEKLYKKLDKYYKKLDK